MPNIEFKAKVKQVYNMDDSLAWEYVKVPKIQRTHCDMHAFRMSPKYGSYANSDLFSSMISRAFKAAGIKENIRLDQLPSCVSIDTSGFLVNVTIEI